MFYSSSLLSFKFLLPLSKSSSIEMSTFMREKKERKKKNKLILFIITELHTTTSY